MYVEYTIYMPFYKPVTLCIPKIDTSISNDTIFKKLIELDIGYIYKIFEMPYKNETNLKTIFIKFSWNTKNKHALSLKNKLYEKGSLKLVYDDPWYWKIVETKKIDKLYNNFENINYVY